MDQPINRYLDAAILKPETSRADARAGIEQMVRCRTITVCVRPCDIPLAVELCRGTETAVSCVLGFPHGVILSGSKADEARRYLDLGVAEIDMVANYGLILSGEWELVEQDIRAVSGVTGPAGVLLKVILETCQLSTDRIARATGLAADAGADFVKTSTGFSTEGATEEAVRTMVEAAAGRIRIKASGGIRDMERARRFIEMGCSRLGVNYTTAAVLCGEAREDSGGSPSAGGPSAGSGY